MVEAGGKASGYRYAIGVDLGTTNSTVAYVNLRSGRRIEHFEIPQIVAPGELGRASTLPSFLYLPGAHELPEGSLALPWDATRDYVVGLFAREQGSKVPAHLVSSAKSWLSHAGVDRTANILPWRAPRGVEQVSPVEASARYLQHLREAWNERMAGSDDAARFERQLVVLTVPASFDEVARELTVQAAKDAGIPDVVLLEEPLAAFYAWMDGHGPERDALQDGQIVLVCDVGGGTSDFSIIGVRRDAKGIRFDRLAVGEHLMLGGDNMDHALGRQVEMDVAGGAGKLDVQRWHQLVHQCRRAKEELLGYDAPDRARVAVPARGSGLVSGMLTATLYRDDVERLVLEGFFPEIPLDTPLQANRRSGLTELGLPYEPDPAITRHLAAFWRRFEPMLRQDTGRDDPRPDFVLFNGGVFTPDRLRERVLDIVGSWFDADAWRPQELKGTQLDLAVARGAAYYGLVRLGERARVGSGSPRAYYVGIAAEDRGPEGVQPAMCLVPRGAEEGFEGRLDQAPVEALTNKPVTFHLFTSDTRTEDFFGDVVQLREGDAHALPPIRTVLRFGKKGLVRRIPVELGVRLTEIGTLELYCQSLETEHRWELAFDVRQEPEAEPVLPETAASTPALEQIEAAQAAIREAFEQPSPPGRALWGRLESILEEPRDRWTIPVLRKLADTLLGTPRDRSIQHEAAWFDMLGYTLRPGYGDAVDDWRMQEVWKRYRAGLHFARVPDNRLAWWRFWARVGAGLPAEKQAQVYYDVRPYIQLKVKTGKQHPLYPTRLDAREKLEAWRTLSTFERLPVGVRGALGQLVVESLQRDANTTALWALARLGTRHLIYGPLDSLVPAEEVGGWLKNLLGTKLPKHPASDYVLTVLAQRTGDRGRDVPDNIRQQVIGRLRRSDESETLLPVLEHPGTPLPPEISKWLHGEPMPAAGALLADQTGIVYAEPEQ